MAENVKFYSTISSKLPDLPVRNGNMIFVRDEQIIYLDFNGTRIKYNSTRVFDTDAERVSLVDPPEGGYYYVEETNVFWRYKDKKWIQLSPSNLDPIYFGDVSTFPEVGEEKKLYVSIDGIYQWSNAIEDYILIANSTIWDEFN